MHIYSSVYLLSLYIVLYIIDILVKYEEYNSCCKYTNLFVKLQLTEYLNPASQPRDEHVFDFFSFPTFVCELPISFVFLQSFRFISFVLKIIVYFPSISFVFSLNDRFFKFVPTILNRSFFVRFKTRKKYHFSERSVSFIHHSFYSERHLFHKNFVGSRNAAHLYGSTPS